MRRIGLIADDLTGAMDTALQFSKRGLNSVVSMHWHDLPNAEVVAVNTDSRSVDAAAVRQRSLTVARLLRGRVLYKKVDSTMRGHVGCELRALLDVLRPRSIVLAPAYPRNGRTTLRGRQMVDGLPLERTVFARDPHWPMRESHLPTLLRQQAGLDVGQVGLESVARGVGATVAALKGCPEPLIVVDAVAQEHLCIIADALVALGDDWLPCGSAGLAEEWARSLGMQRQVVPLAPQPGPAPVLVVSGSRNATTIGQLRFAIAKRGLTRIDYDPRTGHFVEGEIARLADASLRALRHGADVILTTSFSRNVAGAGPRVAAVLARVCSRIASGLSLGGLLLTGGDIAVATCRALGARALRVLSEVQAGIPSGQLLGGPHDALWVVTKAGGFGDRRAVLDALDYLHGASQLRATTAPWV